MALQYRMLAVKLVSPRLVQAEHLARKSSAAMESALARLNKAEEEVAVIREAIKAAQAKARNTPKKRKKDAVEESNEVPSFEITAEEREYKGDPNDRKGLVKHRQRMKVRACAKVSE